MVGLIISAALTVFLLATVLILVFSGKEAVDTRLMEIATPQQATVKAIAIDAHPSSGLGQMASLVTGTLKPLRDLIASNDEDLAYRLSLAGLRKPEHVEIYTASKMLLPILALVVASFSGDNMLMVALIGVVAGFFGPDIVVTQLVQRRKDSIQRALPDA